MRLQSLAYAIDNFHRFHMSDLPISLIAVNTEHITSP